MPEATLADGLTLLMLLFSGFFAVFGILLAIYWFRSFLFLGFKEIFDVVVMYAIVIKDSIQQISAVIRRLLRGRGDPLIDADVVRSDEPTGKVRFAVGRDDEEEIAIKKRGAKRT